VLDSNVNPATEAFLTLFIIVPIIFMICYILYLSYKGLTEKIEVEKIRRSTVNSTRSSDPNPPIVSSPYKVELTGLPEQLTASTGEVDRLNTAGDEPQTIRENENQERV